MKKKILDSLQSFFQTIHEISLGFAVKKGRDIVFAHNKNQIFSYTLNNDESNDIEGRFLDISGVDVTSCPLDENNDEIIFVVGEQEYLPEEYELLKFLMEQIKIIPDNDVISSIVGNVSSTEPIETYFSSKTYSNVQNDDKSTIQLPKELEAKLDEFIMTKINWETLEFEKNDPEKMKSLIISSLVKQFLDSTYNYQAEDITGRDMIDVTFMSNFPKCNICRSFCCEHIDIILNDEHILSDLKKDGIIPMQVDFSEFQKDNKYVDKEINLENKSKMRTDQE